jgi:hypothetical protein
MAFEDDVFNTVVPWCRDISRTIDLDATTFRANQGIPTPIEPDANFCVVSIEEGNSDGGRDDFELIDAEADLREDLAMRRAISISVSVYGPTCFEIANKLRGSLFSRVTQRNYFVPGSEAPFDAIPIELGFVSASGIRRFNELVRDKWRARSQFDIVFNTLITQTFDVERVQEIVVNADLKIGDEIRQSFTVTASVGD